MRSVKSSDRSMEIGARPPSNQYSRTASENDHLAIACYTFALIYTIIIDMLVKLVANYHKALVLRLPLSNP